jgi:methionyl-tRNA formyltransferase
MNKSLKIVFAGTPEIAKIVFENILANGFKVELALTQPDRPANRGRQVTMPPVKELAVKHNIEVFQPDTFKNNPEVIDKIRQLKPDIMIVVAYGLILPRELLDVPRLGCVNIHVSLLPAYRGAAPIQRVILAGEKTTGVTIMQMDAGMDTGAILIQQKIAIEEKETAKTLHDKLAVSGARMIVEYLSDYKNYTAIAQSAQGVSYAPKIDKAEAKINWNEDARIIERKIRGFNPAPGCSSMLDGKLIKIWQVEVVLKPMPILQNVNISGEIIRADHQGIVVVCGNNSALLITELQYSGGKRQLADQYIMGHKGLKSKVFST